MKQKSLFYRIYFSVIAIFVLLLAVGIFVFRNWLAGYEAAQPEQIVNTVITEYLEKGDLYSVKDEYNLKLSRYETQKSFNSAIKELTDGKKFTSLSSALKPKDCDAAYVIKADDSDFLKIYLKKDGKTKKYSVSGMEFDKSLYQTFTVSATSDASVKINGVDVDAGDIADEELPNLKNYTNNGKIIKKQIITADFLLNKPESVTATSGKKTLQVSESDNCYVVVQDFAEKDAVSDIAGKAASTYAAYMQNDSNLTNIKKYIDPNTEFYTNIRTSLVIFSLEHESYQIKNLSVTDLHKYSENLFSCRVRLTNVLTRKGNTYEDKFDKYVYLRRDGDTYKAIDMQNAEVVSNE